MRRLLLTISLAFTLSAQAQLETGNWFLNGSRVSVTPGGVATGQPAPPADFLVTQTSSSISDATGELLFASNGSTIIDRDMKVMPALNGVELGGRNGKTLIHPVPGTSKYYVFYHVGNGDDTPDNMSWTLKYAIVDMSLNGGKGDVVLFNKIIEAHSSPSYALAEGGSADQAWVVTHRIETDSFLVYKLDPSGLSSTPVISKAGLGRNPKDFHYWDLKASFDGKRVAGIAFRNNTQNFVVALWHVEVMDFNATTGQLFSNMASQSELSYIFTGMSLEFSPDSKLLYSVMVQRLPDFKPCGFGSDAVRQYQLCHSGTRDLGAFSHILYAQFHDCSPRTSYGRIVLGADKQMHIPFSGDMVSLIKYPNRIGDDCGFVLDGYRAPAFNDSLPGTPQFDPTVMKYAVRNTIIYDGGCLGFPVHLQVTNSEASGHAWDFGDPSSTDNSSTLAEPFHQYSLPGRYKVTVRLRDDHSGQDQIVEEFIDVVDPGVRLLNGFPKDTTICRPGDEAYVLRPKAQNFPMRWYQLDATGREINNQHSDTLSIATSGKWYVELEKNSCLGCRSIDSINVKLLHTSYTPLRDTVICPGGTITIGMPVVPDATIRWSDGSTVFQTMVNGPGTLSLLLSNVKTGCVISDTIQVLGSGQVLGSLPSDTTMCFGEALLIQAVSESTAYQWQNGATGSSFRVDRPGLYWVSTTGATCIARDSILVSYRDVAKIALGQQATLCMGDSLQLDAGAGFLSYRWSSGQTTQRIFLSHPGPYTVAAMNANGCLSRDTFLLYPPYPPPVVELGRSGAICLVPNGALDAGPGMASYTWNTGATTRLAPVSGPGLYSVRVTDDHGCSASDSINITVIHDAPQVRLPEDIGICKYHSVTVRAPEGYGRYLWSTGSTASSVILDREGSYWVQVTDANQCVGSDTIRILHQDCYGGVHVPNAFTPGHDGVNDVFRPIFDGSVTQYRFSVYDRYGQVLFSSTDPNASWDGTHGGRALPAGTYTWVSHYQLTGLSPVTEKGTVVLIR